MWWSMEGKWLTRVGDGDDAGAVEVAVPVVVAAATVVVVVGPGGVRRKCVGLVAAASRLDGPAVGIARAAREVQSCCQLGI